MRRHLDILGMFGVMFFIIAALAGCGGGGGATGGSTKTVSGVAASGAPIIGYAYLKTGSGTTLGPNAIGIDGQFSFDVTGLTPPFYLMAEGNVGGLSVTLHSIAMADGTANINPLTNIALASASNVSDPALVYSNPAAYSISQTAVNTAVADIQSMLQPLLDAYAANINPITGSYAADHTGLDGLLDVVKVELNTGTGVVSVKDSATDTEIGAAAVATLDAPTNAITPAEVPVATVLNDLTAIQAMLSSFGTTLNKGAAITTVDLEPFYAAAFGMDNGQDRTQSINDFVMNPVTMYKTITSMTGLTIDPIAGTGDYKVMFTAYFSDGSFGSPDEGFIVTKEGGAWKLKGNGYWSRHDIRFQNIRWVKTDGTLQTESGINLWIQDPANHGFNTAVITGPGLPGPGITLTLNCGPTQLCIPPASQNNTAPTDNSDFYVFSDSTIDTIPDNAVYTVNIYDAGAALVETRAITLPKRPLKRTELLAGHLPSLSGISSHATSAMNIGGTLTFSIGLPTKFTPAWINTSLQFWDGAGNHADYWKEDLLLTDSSANITSVLPATWTPTGGMLELRVQDANHMVFVVIWMFQ